MSILARERKKSMFPLPKSLEMRVNWIISRIKLSQKKRMMVNH
jgi:hypothetical protein